MKHKSFLLLFGISLTTAACLSFMKGQPVEEDIAELRRLYSSGDQKLWPKAKLKKEAEKGFRDIGVLDKMSYPEDNP
ncbi:MAG TPA: hypothetical protein VGB71_05185, partial [Flavisolibacter sp.]